MSDEGKRRIIQIDHTCQEAGDFLPEELRAGLHTLAVSLYDAETILRRRKLFFRNLRRSARRLARRNLDEIAVAV